MSAFIHNPEHIIAIVASAARLNLGTLKVGRSIYVLTNPVDRWELCALLYAANVRSVNYRYHTRQRLAMPHPFGSGDSSLSAAALCKAIDSLKYQSCERGNFDKTLPGRLLSQLRDKASAYAVGRYKKPSTMPEYDKVSETSAYQSADVWAIAQ